MNPGIDGLCQYFAEIRLSAMVSGPSIQLGVRKISNAPLVLDSLVTFRLPSSFSNRVLKLGSLCM